MKNNMRYIVKTNWKMITKNGEKYSCRMINLGILSISLITLGFNKVDIRVTLHWGW
jgi:hypothetical protein